MAVGLKVVFTTKIGDLGVVVLSNHSHHLAATAVTDKEPNSNSGKIQTTTQDSETGEIREIEKREAT